VNVLRRLIGSLPLIALVTAGLLAAPAQRSPFFSIDEVQPGMVGTGRTVFAGDALDDFTVHIVGVLRNVIGPRRDLVLARLEGGPLANTGVIQGMSGSPVYIDGRLLGAVSYSLGSFSKEALAGITPIGEMTSAVETGGPRATVRELSLAWPAPPTEVFAALSRLSARALEPLGTVSPETRVVGPQTLADLAPTLRPIAAAMVLGGFDPAVGREVRTALSAGDAPSRQSAAGAAGAAGGALRPGDPIGVSLVRGDLEMGATGTVTHVDGSHVYAFGHPFLNLGPTAFAMTRAHVFTVLPSLESSIKIATLGPVIGTLTQDRATAIAGTLGEGPKELEVNLSLTSESGPARRVSFSVLRDQTLTPLFTYVAILNSLTAYDRQVGALSISARGALSFGSDGTVVIDDAFAGDNSVQLAAAGVTAPVGSAMANEFKSVMPDRLDLEFHTSEKQEGTTIERAWLDTTRPRFGATHTLQVQLRDYRGGTRVVSLPVTMPAQADGPLTLLVSDAATLTTLEQHDLKPGKPTSWPELLTDLNAARRGNRLYVRLMSASAGAVVLGETWPALPASVRAVLDTDSSVARGAVARTVVGAWEQRLDVAVHGSRELTLTLTPQ